APSAGPADVKTGDEIGHSSWFTLRFLSGLSAGKGAAQNHCSRGNLPVDPGRDPDANRDPRPRERIRRSISVRIEQPDPFGSIERSGGSTLWRLPGHRPSGHCLAAILDASRSNPAGSRRILHAGTIRSESIGGGGGDGVVS